MMAGPPPPRTCMDGQKSRCCGDGVCDGPETQDNCKQDCNGTNYAGVPAGRPPPPPPGLGGPPPFVNSQGMTGGPPPPLNCTAGQTSHCCGDRVCDGPETQVNCKQDCNGTDYAGVPAGPPPPVISMMGEPPSSANGQGMMGGPPPPLKCTGRMSRCCGDGVCDGPETLDNCKQDCNGTNYAGMPAGPPPPPPGFGGPPPFANGLGMMGGPPPPLKCTAGQTSHCCGDGVCDGPETQDNCKQDCNATDYAGISTGPPPPVISMMGE